jgi:ribose transport system substrate-binding protein
MSDLRSKNPRARASYTIDAVARACQVLASFGGCDEIFRLRDLVRQTNLNKTTVFRILCTLEQSQFVDHLDGDRYRSRLRILRPQRFRVAYAGLAELDSFSRAVTEGLRRSALDENIDLIEFDNKYSPTQAIRNAEKMIQTEAHVAIEYQAYERVAPVISEMFREAKMPLIAISVPHPGSVYFGPDGYESGRAAGEALGNWVKREWNSQVDEVILLEVPFAGAVPHSRLTGVLTALRESIGSIADHKVKHLNGRGRFDSSLEAVRQYIRGSRARRVVIAGASDISALAAIRAFEEAGRPSDCVATGQGGALEARLALRRPQARLLGTVAFFPENYGSRLIRLATDLFHDKALPPAVFTRHRFITKETVDRYYPNDVLFSGTELENLLLQVP